jgi:apolipoprotein N-acyltransferase
VPAFAPPADSCNSRGHPAISQQSRLSHKRTTTAPKPAANPVAVQRSAVAAPGAEWTPLIITRRWPVLALTAAALCMQCLIFAPYAVWPLAYVCLVPWVVAMCASRRPRTVYIASYLLGAGFFLINLRWLRFSTAPGYVALCLWSGLHFLIAAIGIRYMYRRRHVPLAVLVPVIWTMTELARSRTALCFPWFLLAHSHYRILTMIQISDLVGAFGVSFVLAAVNGWICDLLLERVWIVRPAGTPGTRPRKRLAFSTAFALLLLFSTIAYGRFRLGQESFSDGPKIAVLQGDYVLSPEMTNDVPSDIKRDRYMQFLKAAAPQRPDLYLLPETPWSMYLNKEFRALDHRIGGVRFSQECHETFCSTAETHNAYVVVGSVSMELHPTRVYPKYERFNSAFVYSPPPPSTQPATRAHCPEPGRYDKIHLVLFGEYVPFRYGALHSVYRKLNSLTPWGANGEEYSLTWGKEYTVFDMHTPSQAGRDYHFAVPICYEDVIPHLIRKFVTGPDGRKRVDFLLNISNDGWFLHSTELPQHLAACAFRAVENRVGIARAVNTGVSGFIDPDGRIRDLVEEPGSEPWQGVEGYSVSDVKVDSRQSLYSRFGDWFADGCGLLGLLCLIDVFVARVRANWFRRKDTES